MEHYLRWIFCPSRSKLFSGEDRMVLGWIRYGVKRTLSFVIFCLKIVYFLLCVCACERARICLEVLLAGLSLYLALSMKDSAVIDLWLFLD